MRFMVVVCALVLVAFGIDVNAFTVGGHLANSGGFIGDYQNLLGITVFGAALSTAALTLADWAKRLDPDGKTATIVELLSQTNEILRDMRWVEGNLETGHRTTVR